MQIKSYSLFWFSVSIFFLYFSACKQPQKTIDDIVWEKENKFFHSLPLASYDSTITLIEDSIKTPQEQTFLYRIFYNNVWYHVSPEKYLRYYRYMEQHIPKEDYTMQGTAKLYRGKAYLDMGRKDSTFDLANEGMEIMKKGNDTSIINYSFFVLGSMYLRQGFSLSASNACLEGLKYTTNKEGHRGTRNLLLNTLLISYRKQKNYQAGKALAHQIYTDALAQKDTSTQIDVLITYTIFFTRLSQKDSALWAANQAEKLFRPFTKLKESMPTLMGLAFVWKESGNPEKALAYWDEIAALAERHKDKSVMHKVLYGRGNLYMLAGDLAQAEGYYRQLLADKDLPRNTDQFKQLNDSLVVLSLKKNQRTEELRYYYTSRQLADSLAIVESGQTWTDINVRYETEKKERELVKLTSQNQSWQIRILVVSLCLVVGIFATLWLLYRNRQKNLLLEKQNELIATNQLMHQKELAANQQQLKDFMENLLTKNQLIEQMETQMKEIMANAVCISKEEYEQSKEKLNAMKILTEQDWKTYLEYFEKVNPNLVQKASEQLQLTQSELRLFLLIRQNLSKEEITNALGISSDGTRKSIYRLRKKLNLNDEKALEQFIHSF